MPGSAGSNPRVGGEESPGRRAPGASGPARRGEGHRPLVPTAAPYTRAGWVLWLVRAAEGVPMPTTRCVRTGLVLSAVVSVTAAALTTASPTAMAATTRNGLCHQISHCTVVAFKDVDGDGRRDRVGYVARSTDRAVLRVSTAAGRLLRKSLDTSGWAPGRGGEWLGAAALDGRRGVELVAGTSRGAHAMLFTVVTYRHGRLVRESVPGPGHEWIVDSSLASFAGVWRRVVDGRVVVTLKSAERVEDGVSYRGIDRRFVWRDGAWRHVATVRTTYPGPRRAGEIAGWHVRGLPTWPGRR